MNKTRSLLQAGVLGLSLLATSVMAAVSADEAAKLVVSGGLVYPTARESVPVK